MLKDIWKFWKAYFLTNPKRLKPILLTLFIISMEFSLVYLNVQFNEWRNDFYDSLQNVDYPAFLHNLKRFTYLALTFVGVFGYKTYIMQKLQINWREWMTGTNLGKWLNTKMYYGLQFLPQAADNIDQRISEDINSFVNLSISLTLGFLSSVTTFVSFIFILWTLSDSATFLIYGHHITIGHYLVWAVLVYSVLGTYITKKIGKPLSRLNYEQELLEANFRYSLVRARENSESIALFQGENFENENFLKRFKKIVTNFNKINNKQKHLNWWSNYFGQVAIIFPFIVCAPKFFAKEIKLGGLMQTASAFNSVQDSLAWIVNSYIDIATYRAVVTRLKGFEQAVIEWEKLEEQKKVKFVDRPYHGANDLSIILPNGNTILDGECLTFSKGMKYIVAGPSGSGKSTLLRTLAGIWPYASGEICNPDGTNKMFLSQSPYMPLGTLLQTICYPQTNVDRWRGIITVLMTDLGMHELLENADKEMDWNKILSGGQKQKIAFIRAVLQNPDILFIDEGTSNMDEDSEDAAYRMLIKYLKNTTIVSVGHRQTIEKHHQHKLILKDKKIESKS